jgi:hypothetical protein
LAGLAVNATFKQIMSPKQGVRNPPSNQEGLQALKDLIDSYETNQEVDKLVEQTAVKYCLQLLHQKAPGNSVEVRIPPYARIWIDLAIGKIDWVITKNSGSISASGERADLSAFLPLISAQDLAN